MKAEQSDNPTGMCKAWSSVPLAQPANSHHMGGDDTTRRAGRLLERAKPNLSSAGRLVSAWGQVSVSHCFNTYGGGALVKMHFWRSSFSKNRIAGGG